MPIENSRIGGFYKLSVSERRELLAEIAELSEEQVEAWAQTGELDEESAAEDGEAEDNAEGAAAPSVKDEWPRGASSMGDSSRTTTIQ